VRALADNQRRPLEAARLCNRQVILAKVHPVGSRRHSDVWAVVYYAQDAGISAYLDELNGKGEKRVIPDGLCSKLNTVGPADRTFARQTKNLGRQVTGHHNVQPDACVFLRSIAEKNDILLERISGVAEPFNGLGHGLIVDPDDLGQHPQGLGQTFAGGRKTVVQVTSFELCIDLPADTDIAERIPARNEPLRVKPADRRAEFVPEPTRSFGQRTRIQSESAEFLDSSACLTSAIEIGVNNSVSRSFHDARYYMSDCRF
jgi:hypothetical protein